MLIVTINEVPGKKIEALGVVRGSTCLLYTSDAADD